MGQISFHLREPPPPFPRSTLHSLPKTTEIILNSYQKLPIKFWCAYRKPQKQSGHSAPQLADSVRSQHGRQFDRDRFRENKRHFFLSCGFRYTKFSNLISSKCKHPRSPLILSSHRHFPSLRVCGVVPFRVRAEKSVCSVPRFSATSVNCVPCTVFAWIVVCAARQTSPSLGEGVRVAKSVAYTTDFLPFSLYDQHEANSADLFRPYAPRRASGF